MSKYQELLISTETLSWAWRKAQRLYHSADTPFDVAELAAFELDLERQLQSIARDFASARYKLSPLVLLPQPKKQGQNGKSRMRQSFHISVRDQVAWIAIVNVIGPTLDSKMPLWSYGHRLYKTAWYEETNGRSRLELGPYRHTGGNLYRRFKHSWPLFRRHISLTARTMVRGLGNPDLLDPAEKSARNFPERPPYLEQHHWPTSDGSTLYYGSIDLEKFYPRIGIPSIIRSLDRFLDTFSDDTWLQSLLKRMLSFRVTRERSTLLGDSTVEPRTTAGPFRGIPTNLMVAGFLSNVAMLPLDTLVNEWLQKNNRIAHFRFVDDHVILAYDFDQLCHWIRDYKSSLKAFDIGPEISKDKYDPSSLSKAVNGASNETEKIDAKEQSRVDGQNPSKLMTKTLALVSEIAGAGFDILADQSREMRLSELEWLLLANIPDREIRPDTRAAFAAGQIAKLVPLLFTPSTELLEKSRSLARLKANKKLSAAEISLAEQEFLGFQKKELNRYRSQTDHYFKLLFQAFRDHLDKPRLMVRVLDYCRATGQPGTFSLLRYVHERTANDQPLANYLIPLAIQTIARHIVTASFDMRDSELLARQRLASRRYLETITRQRVRTLLVACVSSLKDDLASLSAERMFIAAVSCSLAVIQDDSIRRGISALAESIEAPELLSGSTTWLAKTGSPIGIWTHWLDSLIRVGNFEPGQVWRLTAPSHEPDKNADWANLRKGPELFPPGASEYLRRHVKRLKYSDAGWLLDQQSSLNPVRLDQIAGTSSVVRQLRGHFSELHRRPNYAPLSQWVTHLRTLSPYDPRAGEWSALEIVRQLVLRVQNFGGRGLSELDELHPSNILVPKAWMAAEPADLRGQRIWTWEAWKQIVAEGKVLITRNKILDYRRHSTDDDAQAPDRLWRIRLRGVGLLLFGLCRRDFSLPSSWNVRGLERDVVRFVRSQLEETAISSCTQSIIEAAILPRSSETALIARNLWAFFGSRPVTSIDDTATDPPNIVDEQELIAQIQASQAILTSNQISVLNHAARQLIPMNAVQLTKAVVAPIIMDDEP